MLIDAHSHLESYGDLLDSALEEIEKNRILTISNSIDVPSYNRNLELAERSKLVVPTFGVHPWTAPQHADRLEELKPFLASTPMIGEVGLDFRYVTEPSKQRSQREVLEFFLDAAARESKVVSLHTLGAEREVLGLLDGYGIERAIVHWYSGDLDTLREMIDRGFYFTVGYEVRSSKHIRKIASTVPKNRILTETDNPGGPQWLIGEVRMPLLVKEVIAELAHVKGVAPGEIEAAVADNLADLIRGDAHTARLSAVLEE